MKKNQVVTNSIIYTLSGLLLKCFSFFLLPLYTKYLTPEDYGITSVATSFAATMSFIVALSLYSAVARFYVDYKNEPEKLKRFYGTVSTFTLGSAIIWGVLLTVFRKDVSRYIFSGVDYYPVIFVCLLSLLFNCQHTIYENILRSQQKATKCSIMSVLYFFITLVGNLFFVAVLKLGAIGVLLSTLIAGFLYTVVFFVDMTRSHSIIFCLDLELLKEALKYSIPIMPHNLATQVATLLSKIFISGSYALSAVGIFSIATQFGNLADTIQIYVNNAYGPWLFEVLSKKKAGYQKQIRENVNLLISVIGLFFVALAFFSHDYIILLINKAYTEAWVYVPLIVMVNAIKTTYYFFVNVLFFYKEASKKLFLSTLSGAIANTLFSYYLIPIYGIIGSIMADAIAMLLRVIIVIIMSLKYERIGLSVSDFIKNFLAISICICLGMIPSFVYYKNQFSFLNFGFKLIMLVMYVIYVVKSNNGKNIIQMAKKIRIGKASSKNE